MYTMQAYDDALQLILDKGVWRSNKRTGIRCLSYPGILSRYRIDESFPILTRRKVWPKSIFAELLWFISGSTCNKDLQALGANIWTPWVDAEFEKKHGYAEGCFGKIYGYQLRHFGGEYGNGLNSKGGFDQLAWMVNRIKEDPSCRRILFSLWNPNDYNEMKLAPCHYTYQVFIDDDGRMTGIMTQRSCDFPVGVWANIFFYSLLTTMLAQQTGYTPYEFVHSTVDSHIYENQLDAVKEYLATPIIDSPKLNLNKAPDIFSYKMDDLELIDFNSGPTIKIPVAV
jgi:thymidylate synthase